MENAYFQGEKPVYILAMKKLLLLLSLFVYTFNLNAQSYCANPSRFDRLLELYYLEITILFPIVKRMWSYRSAEFYGNRQWDLSIGKVMLWI